MSVGMTAIILTGGIDLSVGSVVALAGVVAALAAHALEPTLGGLAATLVAIASAIMVGVATGGITATAVAFLRIPSFLVTLALLTICRGLAFLFSGGRSIGDLPTPVRLARTDQTRRTARSRSSSCSSSSPLAGSCSPARPGADGSTQSEATSRRPGWPACRRAPSLPGSTSPTAPSSVSPAPSWRRGSAPACPTPGYSTSWTSSRPSSSAAQR